VLQEPSFDLPAHALPPRASLVAEPGALPGLRSAIWMGGAHSLRGEPLHPAALETAWLVDCAGDMPRAYRDAAGLHIACVFADLEALVLPSRHILPVVDRLAAAVTAPAAAPAGVYIMCTHGMNRSGLVAGLLLRRLGLDADGAVAAIRAARPGALSNGSFVDLLRRA
jgi:hypothetical protein